MNLKILTSGTPAEKPWLNCSMNSLDVTSINGANVTLGAIATATIDVDELVVNNVTTLNGVVEINGQTFPDLDGASNQVLITDGLGDISWENVNVNDLDGLTITTPIEEDCLVYDTGEWVNRPLFNQTLNTVDNVIFENLTITETLEAKTINWVEEIKVKDNVIVCGDTNPADLLTQGLIMEHFDGVAKYSGILRDGTNHEMYVVENISPIPGPTSDVSLMTKGDLNVGSLKVANYTLPLLDGVVGSHIVTDAMGNLDFEVPSLNDLSDVNVVTPLDRQVLVYDAGEFKNQELFNQDLNTFDSPIFKEVNIADELKIGTGVPANQYLMPTTRGTINQVLVSNGAGITYFSSIPDIYAPTMQTIYEQSAYPEITTTVAKPSLILRSHTASFQTIFVLENLSGVANTLTCYNNGQIDVAGSVKVGTANFTTEYTLPLARGNNTDVISTDGFGIASWIASQNVASTASPSFIGLTLAGSLRMGAGIYAGGLAPLTSLFSQTADKTIANTTVETTLIGAGEGFLSLPGNSSRPGSTINIKMGGYMDTNLTPNITLRYKVGNVAIYTQVIELPAMPANSWWELSSIITVRTIGVGGTMIINGVMSYDDEGIIKGRGIVNTGIILIDTTTAKTIDLTAQWDVANVSNNITSQHTTISTLF